jgi:hypothetical protein
MQTSKKGIYAGVGIFIVGALVAMAVLVRASESFTMKAYCAEVVAHQHVDVQGGNGTHYYIVKFDDRLRVVEEANDLHVKPGDRIGVWLNSYGAVFHTDTWGLVDPPSCPRLS